jgi:hypothetical protein
MHFLNESWLKGGEPVSDIPRAIAKLNALGSGESSNAKAPKEAFQSCSGQGKGRETETGQHHAMPRTQRGISLLCGIQSRVHAHAHTPGGRQDEDIYIWAQWDGGQQMQVPHCELTLSR